MVYKNEKTGYWHTRLKGEAEALFSTRDEAELYQKEHNEFEKIKHNEVK